MSTTWTWTQVINAIKGVTNNGSISHTFTPSGSEQTYTVPKGYHSGSGTVKCKAVTLDGNAWPYAVLDGATFYSNSLTKQVGAMSNRGNKSGVAVAINTNYPNCPVWPGESTQQSWGHAGEAMVATCPPGGYYPGYGSAYVGIPLSTFGNAGSGDVLSGKTFTSSNGFGGSGSMTNHGALNWKPNSGTTYSVTAGYYSGGTLDSTDAYNAGYTAGAASVPSGGGSYSTDKLHNVSKTFHSPGYDQYTSGNQQYDIPEGNHSAFIAVTARANSTNKGIPSLTISIVEQTGGDTGGTITVFKESTTAANAGSKGSRTKYAYATGVSKNKIKIAIRAGGPALATDVGLSGVIAYG